ncbi:MAG: spore coat protein GerQ, partial [Bacillota bacterium]
KVATVYTTNENNPEWAARVFKGRVENAARDHVVLSDPETGVRYVILMVNIDFITFDEPLRYEPGIYRM